MTDPDHLDRQDTCNLNYRVSQISLLMSKGLGISWIGLTGATLIIRVGLVIVKTDGLIFLFCHKSSNNSLGNHTTHGCNAFCKLIVSRFAFLTEFVTMLMAMVLAFVVKF